MYRLMIVDDDAPIRERLKAVIPFEKLDLACVGEAANGEEALALFEQESPHIVLADINIPLIDGMALAKRMIAIDPDAQIIMITGFARWTTREKPSAREPPASC
jgi:two-component system response regulator YesN